MKGKMFPKSTATALILSLGLLTSAAWGAAKVGEAAPGFQLKDTQGKEWSLDSLIGKWVVLEWINFDCPFVKKHYGSGNMQALQKKWRDKDVVWLAINSSAEGKQGNFPPDALETRMAKEKIASTAYLLDADGSVGKLYGAKTTPHMYVIDPQGKLLYAGAIDDKPTTREKDIEGAVNYVTAALEAGMAGEAVETPATQPYGCSVKYAE